MIKTYKVMLVPNNKQKSKFFQNAGCARFAYNWAISKIKDYYKETGKFINAFDLRKEFTKFKSEPNNKWLYSCSNDILKQSIKDAHLAYERFLKGLSDYPNFKSRRKSKPSFYCDTFKIEFDSNHVKLEKIANSTKKNRKKLNWIRLAEKNRIPIKTSYCNPRITYDGFDWWISVGIEEEYIKSDKPYSEGIGIDLGVKDLIICSNNITYKNINKTRKVKLIEKRKKRLQRSISRKYLKNKKGKSYCKTQNIKKIEKKVSKLNKRLTYIRTDYLYKCINDMTNRKPRFINMEDLNAKGMVKNHKIAKSVSEASFNKIKQILIYKCVQEGIDLRLIDRWFPSSKTCSKCGNVKKELKLSERIYVCECCGLVIDRDFNASINILNYKF